MFINSVNKNFTGFFAYLCRMTLGLIHRITLYVNKP